MDRYFTFIYQRSTNDNLVRLETFIRDAFVKKEHVVAVFFDLEKAYDTTWKYGILRDLHEFGVKGRLANFVESFLANRSIQVHRLYLIRLDYLRVFHKGASYLQLYLISKLTA